MGKENVYKIDGIFISIVLVYGYPFEEVRQALLGGDIP